jgi:hypothetical protein
MSRINWMTEDEIRAVDDQLGLVEQQFDRVGDAINGRVPARVIEPLRARRITHNVAGPPGSAAATCGDGQQNPRGPVTGEPGTGETGQPSPRRLLSQRARRAPIFPSPLKMAPHSPRHCTATTINRILVVGPSARRISGQVLNFGNTWNNPPRPFDSHSSAPA